MASLDHVQGGEKDVTVPMPRSAGGWAPAADQEREKHSVFPRMFPEQGRIRHA